MTDKGKPMLLLKPLNWEALFACDAIVNRADIERWVSLGVYKIEDAAMAEPAAKGVAS